MDFRIDPRTVLSTPAQSGTTRKERQLAKLKESAKELEINFLNEMVKAMRKTVPEGGLFKKNSAEKLYEEMLDTEFARAMSTSQNIGLANAIYKQMAPLVENRVETADAARQEKDSS